MASADANGPGGPEDRAARLPSAAPSWRGIGFTALIGLMVLALMPGVRAWAWRSLYLPVVADALGSSTLVVDGVVVTAGYTPWVQILLASVFVLLLLIIRARLMSRDKWGALWAGRVRLDGAFVLSLVPLMALAPVLAALESGLLFNPPWSFFIVPPLLVLFMVALAVVSILFGLWIEHGGPKHSIGRFMTALLVFVSFDLFWISVSQATTTRLAWWAAPAAMVIAVGVFFGVTLGNRLLSHRRALFALGSFHTAFFMTFLAQWIIVGPWPVHDWSYAGAHATRLVLDMAPRNGWMALLPPIGIATGLYTIGAFLHRYHVLARPFTDGLNVVLIFSQALDAWATTVRVVDPYGVLVVHGAAPDALAAWSLGLLGGYGYLAIKVVFALVAVLLLDLPFRDRPGPLPQEASHVARGALVALGLMPGLRTVIMLTTGL